MKKIIILFIMLFANLLYSEEISKPYPQYMFICIGTYINNYIENNITVLLKNPELEEPSAYISISSEQPVAVSESQTIKNLKCVKDPSLIVCDYKGFNFKLENNITKKFHKNDGFVDYNGYNTKISNAKLICTVLDVIDGML